MACLQLIQLLYVTVDQPLLYSSSSAPTFPVLTALTTMHYPLSEDQIAEAQRGESRVLVQ